MEERMEVAEDNPFAIFPKELWEKIVNLVEEEDEIALILEAIPPLQCFSHSSKFNWRISYLLPLLVPKYLPFETALICRVVSKRWNSAITSIFANHVDLAPCKIIRCSKTTLPPTHFNFQKFPPFTSCSRRGHLFCRHFLQITDLNPTLPLVQDRGGDVYFLEVILLDSDYPLGVGTINKNTLQKLLQIYRHLPNLRSLKIAGKLCREIVEDPPPNAPPISSLETLDISELLGEKCALTIFLQNLFSKSCLLHLQKLTVHVNQWTAPYFLDLFPNLSDLHFHGHMQTDKPAALKTIAHPNLRKLQITNHSRFPGFIVPQILASVENLSLEDLQIVDTHVATDLENISLQFPSFLLPTLQNLTVPHSLVVNYTFLKALPVLKYLTISLNTLTPHPSTLEESEPLTLLLLKYLYPDPSQLNLDDLSIWEEFPALKMLTVTTKSGTILYQFCREYKNRCFSPKAPDFDLQALFVPDPDYEQKRHKFETVGVVHTRIQHSETTERYHHQN